MGAHGISAEEATVGALMWKEHDMWRSKGPSMGARNKNSSLVLEGVGLRSTSLPFGAPKRCMQVPVLPIIYSLASQDSHHFPVPRNLHLLLQSVNLPPSLPLTLVTFTP